MATTTIKVPDIGDFDEVDVIEVLVAEGDTVEAEQSLITLESDKATMEVPAESAGKVSKVLIKVGDKVAEGTAILELETDGTDASDKTEDTPAASEPAEEKEEKKDPAADTPETDTPKAAEPAVTKATDHQLYQLEADAEPVPVQSIDSEGHRLAHASPAVRRYARELGIDLSGLSGSGRKGRIMREDVQQFVKQAVSQTAGGGTTAAPAAGGHGHPTDPGGGLQQVRRGRGTATVPDQAEVRAASAPLLAQRAACHPVRRGRHHRA